MTPLVQHPDALPGALAGTLFQVEQDGGQRPVRRADSSAAQPGDVVTRVADVFGAGLDGWVAAEAAGSTPGGSSLTFRGPWDGATAYVMGDVVSDAGSSWAALAPNTNVTPTEGASWTLLAGKGADGADGLSLLPRGPWDNATAYVPNDVVSHDGSSWVALAANAGVEPSEGATWTLLASKGDPGAPGGGASARGDVTITTAALAHDATEHGTIALGKSGLLFRLESSVPTWVRLYASAADRAADAARPVTEDPSPGRVLAEVRTQASGLVVDCCVPFRNGDTPAATTIYYALTNESGGASTVGLTVNRLPLE